MHVTSSRRNGVFWFAVNQLVDFSQRNPMELLHDTDSAFHVASFLGSGLHRVVLLDDSRCVRALLTRADVIRFIHTLLDRQEVKAFFEGLTLSKVGFEPKFPVQTILPSDTLQTALHFLRQQVRLYFFLPSI